MGDVQGMLRLRQGKSGREVREGIASGHGLRPVRGGSAPGPRKRVLTVSAWCRAVNGEVSVPRR